jgi:hypothetical protein
MKSFSRILLLGAVAVAAIAVSVAPSEAAKKKAAKACMPGAMCVSKAGVRQHCDGSGKWVAVLAPACSGPSCGGAPKC